MMLGFCFKKKPESGAIICSQDALAFTKKRENFGRRGEPYPAMLISDKHKKVNKMPYKERKYW